MKQGMTLVDILMNEIIVRYHTRRMEGHTEQRNAAKPKLHDL